MCKKLLCKYKDESEWEEYIIDYTDPVDIDKQLSDGFINYLIPVRPYKRWDMIFHRCLCHCSEEDDAYPTIKYDGKTYNLWKPLSAKKFISKFNQDARLLAELSRIENAIDDLP